MIEISAVKLKDMKDTELLNRLIVHLSEDKQNRVKRFRNTEDALRTVVADILVRVNACDKLGIKNKDIIFNNNKYGKPYLEGYKEFCFNISHSCEWVVCAVHNLPVGIDIEINKPIDLKIAERFYSKHEFNELISRDDSQRAALFYDLWTLRESYVKAVGMGFYIPFSSFSFLIDSDNGIELVTDSEPDNYYFRLYDIDSNYKMAVCSRTNEFPRNIILKELDKTFDKPLLDNE